MGRRSSELRGARGQPAENPPPASQQHSPPAAGGPPGRPRPHGDPPLLRPLMAAASRPAGAKVLILAPRAPDLAPASGPLPRLCHQPPAILDACWAHSLLHFRSLLKCRHRPAPPFPDHRDLNLQSLRSPTLPPRPSVGLAPVYSLVLQLLPGAGPAASPRSAPCLRLNLTCSSCKAPRVSPPLTPPPLHRRLELALGRPPAPEPATAPDRGSLQGTARP